MLYSVSSTILYENLLFWHTQAILHTTAALYETVRPNTFHTQKTFLSTAVSSVKGISPIVTIKSSLYTANQKMPHLSIYSVLMFKISGWPAVDTSGLVPSF